jgi:hypothetical protein
MSRHFQAPRYAAISYTIDNLALDKGATFSGELSIEPEGENSGDWYIWGACSDDPEDENKIIYFDANTNADTFKAICASVYSNVDLCMAIGDEARED